MLSITASTLLMLFAGLGAPASFSASNQLVFRHHVHAIIYIGSCSFDLIGSGLEQTDKVTAALTNYRIIKDSLKSCLHKSLIFYTVSSDAENLLIFVKKPSAHFKKS